MENFDVKSVLAKATETEVNRIRRIMEDGTFHMTKPHRNIEFMVASALRDMGFTVSDAEPVGTWEITV